ncbi:MAG: hypothetical protein ACK4UZ_03995 [Rhizobium rhizophilum]
MPETAPPSRGGLLFPAAPIGGESLPGYLARLAAINHLPSVDALLADAGVSWRSPDISRIIEGHVSRVAAVVEIEPRRLESLMVKHTGSHAEFFGVRLHRRRILHGTRRVSPRALRASPHHRVAWMVRPLSFCSEGWDRLIDRCPDPVCGLTLGWKSSYGVECCGACGFDLRMAEATEVPEAERPALSVLAGLVSPEAALRTEAVNALPAALRRLPPAVLFEIALSCAQADTDNPHEADRRITSAPLSPTELARGIGYLIDYPASLEAKARTSGANASQAPFFVRLSRLAREAPAATVAEFLDEAVRLAEPIRHGPARLQALRKAEDCLTLREAAAMLKISRSEAKKLADSGDLPSSTRRGDERIHRWFEQKNVAELAARLRQQISPLAFSREYGLPMDGVEQLVDMEIIALSESRAVRIAYPDPRLDRRSVDRFLALLQSQISPATDIKQIRITDLFAGIGAGEKPWGEFLSHVIFGRFTWPLGVLNPERFKINELLAPDEFALDVLAGRYPRLLQGSRTTNRLKRGPGMTRQEVENYLNCYSRDVSWLLNNGNLTGGPQPRDTIPRWEVKALGRELISTREIRWRWRVSPEFIENLTKRGIVRALGPFWPRAAVTEYLTFIFPAGRPVQEDKRW